MKKFNIVAGALAAVAILASCSGNEGGSGKKISISDYKNMTVGDSVAYYFGQLSATEYWQVAAGDTTLKSRESRDQFLKGLRAGFDAVKDNDAYNMGYYKGVALAMQMKELEKEYETKVNKKVLFDGYDYALQSDSAVNVSEVNEEFMKIQESIATRKEAKDRKEAAEVLKKEGAAKKWTRINDTLYGGPVATAGQGANLREGDAINLAISVNTIAGVQIDRRENLDLTVGQMLPAPVTQALLTMKMGETRKFYTPAFEFFGRAYARYNLKPTDVIELTLTAGKAEPKPAATDEAGN